MKTEKRLLYPKGSAVNYLVTPLPKSRSQIHGTIVRNISKDDVIIVLLTSSKNKPRIIDFFFKPRAILDFAEEFDATAIKAPLWAMIAKKEVS